ncbi:16S rRNA (guanine(527)-N(7))-methyltransferase RsmG [Sphingomonas spermidinifaciens]|uniref:Ribosomal RNA small subunit methyltransferase G n=1 Tax=Sphingomonas spermidinifaciens TaxID=1141889 RepID=A0A2A4B9P8_9SPHN|nr:16S rRNA (guanine(527)-N(7))-methyltransferase RsmG [Sphingomonas spermidinifaciens]PCD04499.1 16S rRNA (guanine(527)-N(7))-methyltransferase RsmG [Sphingomonas spermidinifaciens]
MTEGEAREWIADRFGNAAVMRLEDYAERLLAESERQNLIARSTANELWTRHLLDSAQLVPLAKGAGDGEWIDIGSGAGLPGIVAAILQSRHVVMIEPRRRRADFLESVIAAMNLDAEVLCTSAVRCRRTPAAIVSARAVASLDMLLMDSAGFTDLSTIWLLPKGRSAESELADARAAWHGVFHVEPSLTAADSKIVVARQVRRR